MSKRAKIRKDTRRNKNFVSKVVKWNMNNSYELEKGWKTESNLRGAITLNDTQRKEIIRGTDLHETN